MTATRDRFRRLVLALSPRDASDDGLRSAAEIARQLDLGLHALFLEDVETFDAVGHAFNAEVSRVAASPREVAAARLEADYSSFARRTEKRVAAIAQEARLELRFERLRGRLAPSVAGRLGPADVLAIFEPAQAGDRVFGVQTELAKGVAGVCASLTVPARLSAEKGAIVAMAPDLDDRETIELAEHLAERAGAPLEIWTADRPPEPARRDPGPTMRALDTLDETERRRLLRERVRLVVVSPAVLATPLGAAVAREAAASRTPTLALTRARGGG